MLEQPKILDLHEKALNATGGNFQGVEGLMHSIYEIGLQLIVILVSITAVAALDWRLILLLSALSLAQYLFFIDHAKDIRLYDAKDMMVEKWDGYNQECLGNWKWQADQKLPLDMAKKLCYAAKDFVTYLYLGILVIIGKITIGTFSQMLSAGSTLHDSMQGVIWNMQEIVKRTGYAYEYVKFMNYPPAIEKGSTRDLYQAFMPPVRHDRRGNPAERPQYQGVRLQ